MLVFLAVGLCQVRSDFYLFYFIYLHTCALSRALALSHMLARIDDALSRMLARIVDGPTALGARHPARVH